jgi:type IV secretory pathway VirB3-like protein
MEEDMLYVAATRGARTFGGVPAVGWWLNSVGCYLGYDIIGQDDLIHLRGWMWPLVFIVVFLAMRWAVERDPNIFRILQAMAATIVFSRHQVMWAAPWRLPHNARKMASVL